MNAKKILIVEDDHSFARLLEVILNAKGFKVFLCLDASSAMEMAARIQPDLIILDIHMPRRSGTGVLKKLRQEKSTNRTPVIISSSMSSEKAIEQLKKLGADDFVPKSSDPDVLLEKVISHLHAE